VVMQMAAASANVVTFGTNEADVPGSFGLIDENGMRWLAVATADEEQQPKRRKKEQVEIEIIAKKLMPVDALHIRGQHNALNALAALALCRAIGLSFAQLLHGLREYRGEPHRVELGRTIGGVEYYDDSKGTNVGATVAALKGLGAGYAGAVPHLILIAGGDGKGQDFSPLADAVAKYVKAVLLIGKDASTLRQALEHSGV